MTQRSRFHSIGVGVLVVPCFSCTTHRRPVGQSDTQPATRLLGSFPRQEN